MVLCCKVTNRCFSGSACVPSWLCCQTCTELAKQWQQGQHNAAFQERATFCSHQLLMRPRVPSAPSSCPRCAVTPPTATRSPAAPQDTTPQPGLAQEPRAPSWVSIFAMPYLHTASPLSLSPGYHSHLPGCLQTELPNPQSPDLCKKWWCLWLWEAPQPLCSKQELQGGERQTLHIIQSLPTPCTRFICLSSFREGIRSPRLPHLLPQAAGKALLLGASFQACLVSMAN